jgi:hypothetical protein
MENYPVMVGYLRHVLPWSSKIFNGSYFGLEWEGGQKRFPRSPIILMIVKKNITLGLGTWKSVLFLRELSKRG